MDAKKDQSIEMAEVAAIIWMRRWLIASCLLGTTLAFAVFAYLSTPVYRSTSLLISASPARDGVGGSLNSLVGSIGGLGSLAGVTLGAKDSQTEEALAVFRSRQFTQQFILENHLIPVLFQSDFDRTTGKWVGATGKEPTPAKAYKLFDKYIRTVSMDSKSGLITLQIDWRDRIAAANWASDLVRRINAEMRARAIAKADASVQFLQRELSATSEIGTREAINRIIEAQVKERMLANVTEEYAFRVVDKAMPADPDDPVKPKRLLLICGGAFLGLMAGLAYAVLAGGSRPSANSISEI